MAVFLDVADDGFAVVFWNVFGLVFYLFCCVSERGLWQRA